MAIEEKKLNPPPEIIEQQAAQLSDEELERAAGGAAGTQLPAVQSSADHEEGIELNSFDIGGSE